MKYGLVLEGGGMRGAYTVGVWTNLWKEASPLIMSSASPRVRQTGYPSSLSKRGEVFGSIRNILRTSGT